MEEKRRETGSYSPAATLSGASSARNSESPATEPPAPRRRNQKRKSTGVSSAPAKRHAREKAAAAAAAAAAGLSSLLPPFHNGPLTRARQLSDNNAAISSALNAVENERSAAAAAAASAAMLDEGREEANAAKEHYEALEAAIEAEFEAIRSRDPKAHVVPVAAGWFSWTNIHPLEKQTLRSFFNGKSESRTPEIYMEIRNWIMKRFHANPSTNIELKDLSALSIGDLDARQEIMEFLDHWGLINYHPFPPNDPANIDAGPNTDGDKEEKIDSLIEKLYQFENEQSYPQIVPRASMSTLATAGGLFPESIAEELVKQEGPAVEYHCNSCSADCSRKRYHCQKQADFDLCTECYNNGKFGSGMAPSDFILMEPAEASGASGGKWTDQETLLLLEALELYKENWNEIAEHVATKTKAQCILHFLEMPIEDGFFDDLKYGDQEIAEPTSINNDVSVPKDKTEPSESKACKDDSEPPQSESGKDISEPPESKNGKGDLEPSESKSSKGDTEPSESKIGKGDTEPSESKIETNTTQVVSVPMDTSNAEDGQDGKGTQGKGDDAVLMALKEAFDVVGYPLTAEDELSFAEAGNPVMALAAFLTQLVEPGVATASARCSIKSMSRSSPGSHIAARHCFVLEDPPDDKREQIGSGSVAAEKIDQNASELVNQDCKNEKEIDHAEKTSTTQNEEKSTPILDECAEKPGEEKSQIQEKGSASGEDLDLTSGRQDECAEKPGEEKSQIAEKPDEEKSHDAEKLEEDKSRGTEKPDETTVSDHAGPKAINESQNPSLQNDQPSCNLKDQDESATEVRPPPGSGNEPGNVDAATKAVQCTEAPKDVAMDSQEAPLEKTEQQETVVPDPVVGVGPETGEDRMKVDKSGADKTVETTEKDKMEVDKTGDAKSMETSKIKDDDNVAKLKRAALATLSAAAVKAKLLANQEEDEIRQLATSLIEKQMRKLEIKLSFFSEMENAMLRVREQLERSRQKLYSERAQIIASRLGLPASSSSRTLPSSLPMNKVPPGLLNSIMMRPQMSTAAQKPPMSSRPPGTNTSSAPAEVEGGGGPPTQPSGQ